MNFFFWRHSKPGKKMLVIKPEDHAKLPDKLKNHFVETCASGASETHVVDDSDLEAGIFFAAIDIVESDHFIESDIYSASPSSDADDSQGDSFGGFDGGSTDGGGAGGDY